MMTKPIKARVIKGAASDRPLELAFDEKVRAGRGSGRACMLLVACKPRALTPAPACTGPCTAQIPIPLKSAFRGDSSWSSKATDEVRAHCRGRLTGAARHGRLHL